MSQLTIPKEQLRKEINGEWDSEDQMEKQQILRLKTLKDACLHFPPCFHAAEILKNSDLEQTSSKVVRNKLEKKLNIDLSAQKKELDKLWVDSRTFLRIL